MRVPLISRIYLIHRHYLRTTRWEKPFYPTYFFPTSELPSDLLRRSEQVQEEEGTKVYDLVVGDWVAKGAVTMYTGDGKYQELGRLLKVNFASADAWFEEDDRIYGHPKDPYKVNRVRQHYNVHIKILIWFARSVSTFFHHPGTSVSR